MARHVLTLTCFSSLKHNSCSDCAGSMRSEDEGGVAMLPVAAEHVYEHADAAPIEQLMAPVFSELRLTEVSGGVEPSAAAGFFSRKGLERIGQLRKVRANGRLGAHLDGLGQQLLKRAPLDSEAAKVVVEALKVEVDRQLDMIAGSGGPDNGSAADAPLDAANATATSADADADASTAAPPASSAAPALGEVAPGHLALSVAAHAGGVTALATDGRRFVFSAGADGAVLAWHAASMEREATLKEAVCGGAAGEIRALCVVRRTRPPSALPPRPSPFAFRPSPSPLIPHPSPLTPRPSRPALLRRAPHPSPGGRTARGRWWRP